MPGQRFPRVRRIRSRSQFLAVYEHRRKASTRCLTMFGLPNSAGFCRLGLTVPRKVGGAVVRNKVKRRLREIFRRNYDRMPGSIDLVINTYRPIGECPIRELEGLVLDCYRRLVRRVAS